MVAARGARVGQATPDLLRARQSFAGLAGADLQLTIDLAEARRPQRRDLLVGDQEAARGPAGDRPDAGADQAPPDPHRVLGGVADRPQQAAGDGGQPHRFERVVGARNRAARAARHDRVGERLIERAAPAVQRFKRRAIAGQWSFAARAAPPGERERDVQPHDEMSAQRSARSLRADRAAAQRDDLPAGRALEQLADDGLLDGAKRRLAVTREGLGDRAAETLLDQPVGVDGGDAAKRRKRSRRGRLAGAHEADDDDRASPAQLVCHPIRSQ